MNIVTGDTIWSKINNIPNQYAYLNENIECDVVIVGAGVTGALCSYYFTKENINTVIVDQNILGYSSTRACTAILQYEIDKDINELDQLIDLDEAVKCYNENKDGLNEIHKIIRELDDDCGFCIKDCLYYTSKDKDIKSIKDEYELRKSAGLGVNFLDSQSSKDKFSFKITAGIYSDKLAGEIDPYRFTHALVRKSIENGLRVYENTEVIDIDNKEDEMIITTHNNFKIKAEKVIIATGYSDIEVFEEKLVDLTRSFNVVTKPLSTFDGWYNKCIIRDNNDPHTYLRATEDNRIIIGGENEKKKSEKSKMRSLTKYDTKSQAKYDLLLEKLKEMFPQIKNIDVEYTFSGLHGETKDGLPYVGEHEDYKNFYFCLVFGCNGIINAAVGAKLIKDLYLGNYSILLDLFKLDR